MFTCCLLLHFIICSSSMQEPERRSGCGCGSPLRAFSTIDCQKTCSPKACHQGIQLSYHIFRARRVRDRSCRCHSSCRACWTSCSRWACRPCWACRAGRSLWPYRPHRPCWSHWPRASLRTSAAAVSTRPSAVSAASRALASIFTAISLPYTAGITIRIIIHISHI